jgi:glycosyltransferase involved in cell wall biosynthesis
MRIAVVEPVGRGGLIHYAFQLCRALAEEGASQGVEVVLVTDRSYELSALEAPFRVVRPLRLWDAKPEGRGAPGRQPPGRLRRGLRRAGRAARWYRERLRLLGYLRRLRPDVVQLGDLRFAGDLAFLLALGATGTRLADVCHNLRPFALGGRAAGTFGGSTARAALSRFAFRRIYRRFDAVFVHWPENRELFLAAYGPLSGLVRAIPHGNQLLFAELRDPAVTAETLRRRLGLAADQPVVLAFGTLAAYKGLDLLVEAFARLLPRVPAARLVIAGFPLPGFDPEALGELARRLGIAEAVRVVPGYVPSSEVAAWMELAAVAAFPHREVFQSGVLQAAASLGAPIVASRVGATAEVIRDGETGLLVPPGDAGVLAAALERLLRDPAARDFARRLGERAAEEARSRFAWRAIARELLAAYRELLGEGPAETAA